MEVIVVQNVTSRQRDAEVTYNVKMGSIDDSRSIRRKFGSFLREGKDGRPATMKSFSVKNRVTPDTKIRISVLKLMAKRYRDSNPGSKVQVIGYDPRPVIKLTPPAGASDRRTKIFNYVEACKFFPTSFSASDLDPILRRVSPRLRHQVRSTFIVFSDDMIRSRPQDPSPPEPGTATEADNESGGEAQRGVRRGATSPPGSPTPAKR
jgi:hypothetical protein